MVWKRIQDKKKTIFHYEGNFFHKYLSIKKYKEIRENVNDPYIYILKSHIYILK